MDIDDLYSRMPRGQTFLPILGAAKNTIFRNAPSTAGNSMTGSERPSPEPLLKKEAPPAVLGGKTIPEMLWKPQMP